MTDKKPVFAICHGPQLLINAKALDGRKATGYTSIRVDMENAGADVVDKEVVVCCINWLQAEHRTTFRHLTANLWHCLRNKKKRTLTGVRFFVA